MVRRAGRLFTEEDLERLAGPARFERGRRLLDMVDDEYEDEYSLCATVTDGRAYLAMVHHRVGCLAGECDCPTARRCRSASTRWPWACPTSTRRLGPTAEP